MGKHEKTFRRLLQGGADANLSFDDLCALLRHLGFEERQRGSHHLFSHPAVEELINLQTAGAQAKVYQVRQVRTILLKYGLGRDLLDDESEG
jgi:predicted RNA binding protein YcfA (HicA-like mRNA interferase family)